MKSCNKCGHSNADEAVFCASCGAALEQAPAEAPEAAEQPVQPENTAPAYTAPAYDATAYSAPAAAAAPAEKNKATLWLILNIVLTVVCCGNILGIVGIVFAAIGMGSYKKGDYSDMNSKAKISMILFIVGTVLGLLGLIVAIFSGLLSFLPILSSYNS